MVEDKIKGIIARILHVDTSEVELDTAIGDLDEWDSLHHLQIITAIEECFSCKLPKDELFELEDVSDIVSLVKEYSKL